VAEALPADLAHAIYADPRLVGFASVDYYAEVDSTSDIALARASAGAPEGTAVLADLQRAGRGRRGRPWFSPPGAGLYLSVVTRPPASHISLVTLAAGVAAGAAVTRASGLPVHLKWPNDLVVGRPWRKLGGVLCEATGTGSIVTAVVMGIGINLRPAAYPPEVANRATSIESELGRPGDRAALVVEVLAGIREVLDHLRDDDVDWVLSAWRELAAPGSFGAEVRWSEAGGDRRGIARGIDRDGALLVDDATGSQRVIAGEVSWDPAP